MENATTAIKIGAAIVIVMVVVTIGFMVLRSGQDTAKLGLEKLGQVNSDLDTAEVSMYEGSVVSGSEVLNFIEKNKKASFGVKVITNLNTAGVCYIKEVTSTGGIGNDISESDTDNYINIAKDVKRATYINPNGRFLGKVYKNANGAITGLLFTQQT
ncbi:hypothetical protein DFR58_11966 [Anaerobacterium chartisolvens]|uniref:Uncharacterized protein n=1 Tax=Anaerobacterium chartisolvens TaxID=1297424 RepID=A0A369AUK3_9FIRM|nr:hypothetical protein [Anaerobacterium chartisolvens]RCX13009.1 hypothetical protein DFR58_11966 [Anaerobacterium chartisolvens]